MHPLSIFSEHHRIAASWPAFLLKGPRTRNEALPNLDNNFQPCDFQTRYHRASSGSQFSESKARSDSKPRRFLETPMHRPTHYLPLRLCLSLLPILLCPLLARSQTNAIPGNRGRQVEIDVTIRDGSGKIISSPANVKLYLNGTPCEEGSTSNGRISFTIANLGRFSAVVEAAGYKPGQNATSVAEPVKVDLEVDLQRDPSSSNSAPAAATPILAPKAKEALDRATQALRDDQLDAAQTALDDALKLAPNHPQVLYAEGMLNLQQHEWTKAQTVLEKVTQMEPSSSRALAALGMALCNQKKYTEAISPLEKSLELDPAGGWETRWSLGESYYHNQRYEDALKVSQTTEADSSGQAPQLALLVARSLTAVGRYEDSAKVLRDLLENHPDTPEASLARRYLDRLIADSKIQSN
jgi:TolA-binding protein